MVYYKIFNIEKKAYWLQSKFGYTFDESDAGKWTLKEIASFVFDYEQVIIPDVLDKEQLINILS